MKAEAVVPKAIAFPTPLQSQVEIQGTHFLCGKDLFGMHCSMMLRNIWCQNSHA